MDQILSNCPGILAVHNDVTMYGVNDAEHVTALFTLIRRLQEQGLVYNSTKCSIKQSEISFFGRAFSAEGIKPDPAKIQGILDLPVPKDNTQLKFSGNGKGYASICATPQPSHCTSPCSAAE